MRMEVSAMKSITSLPSTGLPGLDEALTGLQLGDNVVWQGDSVEDYIPFVHPYCKQAYEEKRPLIYFRFADHIQLMPEGVEAEVHQLHPELGFENFISEIFDVIERVGYGGFYVFDCLSELAVDWYSDRMLGNFFMLACPYLYTYETIAYFLLLRNHHTLFPIEAIHSTAQVVIDVFSHKEKLYIHPLKVYKRHSETMYMIHSWDGDKFPPVNRSIIIAEILTSVPQPWLDFSVRKMDIWTRTFLDAQELTDKSIPLETCDPNIGKKRHDLFQKMLRMIVTRDERVLKLAEKYFTLEDLIEIEKRVIGTGLIGGKSVGMLLARAIVRQKDAAWIDKLEPHDSFFIGSDVFYTYLVQNGCWWVRRRLKNIAYAMDGAMEARQRMLSGNFSKDMQNQFMAMLDYFGQSPIIVRSSSLLEDAYGNAFSGKYESVFCANQGTPQERLEYFMNAVRIIYASTMSKEALSYRAHWQLLDQDEQMALLVQRVSGEKFGTQFYPHIAGVGFSFNPFVWNKQIDSQSGMLRLVFGLGTRAVDRADDDYTRIVALNAPMLRPESNFEEVKKFTQRKVDLLDLKSNQLTSKYFDETAKNSPDLLIDIFASRDEEMVQRYAQMSLYPNDIFPWVLTFEKLLTKTDFVEDMRTMLATLQEAYEHPVDIEFTANFITDSEYRINLLQCRPFQVKRKTPTIKSLTSIAKDSIVAASDGPIIGNSMAMRIDRCIFIVPEVYSQLSMNERFLVARIVGQLTHLEGKEKVDTIMLIGPGRWGTTMPALGVPVSFSEINTVSVVCELALMHQGLIPDVSLGTHFFNDLVEMDMIYFAVYPEKPKNFINQVYLTGAKNRLVELIPEAEKWQETIRVIDSSSEQALFLNADVLEQKGILYMHTD